MARANDVRHRTTPRWFARDSLRKKNKVLDASGCVRSSGFTLERRQMTITTPGIYTNCSAAEYHADPAPTPSLSSSIAKLLVSRSPKHGWLAHPRLGGAKVGGEEESGDPSTSKAKALGELIHRLVLGKGADIEVINEDAYRSNAAKAKRDVALAQGKLPVLAHKLSEAQAAADACWKQLDDMGLDYVFRDGMRECVIVWQTEAGVWCRAMIDNLIIDETTKTAEIWDLKSVGRSSHPKACASQIEGMSYDVSLEFYLRGLLTLRPDLAGRVKRRWVFLEVVAPFAATPIEISAEWELAAAHDCDKAMAIWRRCNETGKWPFYVERIERLEPKPWRLADAFMNHDES